jgi:hypothetical protein
MMEDWEMWIRFLAGGERLGAFVGERFGVYRKHRESRTSDLVTTQHLNANTLERAVANGARIPGITASLEYWRGRASVSDGDAGTARHHFLAAARDGAAPAGTRLRALAFATFPALSWRVYSRVIGAKRRRGIARSAVLTDRASS